MAAPQISAFAPSENDYENVVTWGIPSTLTRIAVAQDTSRTKQREGGYDPLPRLNFPRKWISTRVFSLPLSSSLSRVSFFGCIPVSYCCVVDALVLQQGGFHDIAARVKAFSIKGLPNKGFLALQKRKENQP